MSNRAGVCAALAIALLAVLPTTASATFPGSNGSIAIGVQNPEIGKPSSIQLYSPDGADAGGFGVDAGQTQNFSWSADGTRMVGYYGPFPANPAKPAGIYVLSNSGADMVRVLPDSGTPGFLPDGRVIIVRSGGTIWTVNPDGSELQRILPAVTLGSFVYSMTVAPDGRSGYYIVEGNKTNGVPDAVWSVDLTTGAKRMVYSRPSNGGGTPTVGIADVAPNSQSLLLSIATTGEPSGGGRQAPTRLFVIGADGAGLRQLPTAAGERPDGRFSPDGSSVVYLGLPEMADAGSAFGQVEVHVIGVDGSGDRRILTFPGSSQNGFRGLAWQVGPGLDVEVAGGTLTGDLVELDLTLRNPTQAPFTAMRFDTSGHADGVVFNTALYSPSFRAGFTMISGPAPGLASAIGAGSALEHQYLLGVDSPGNVQVRAKAYATGKSGSEIQVEETMYLVARNRDLPRGEEAMMVAGGWAEVQDALHDQTDRAFTSSITAINTTLGPRLPASERSAARTASPVERELAQQSGLPDAALAWLPTDTPSAIKAFVAFRAAKYEASVKVIRRKLGSAYNAGLKVPWDYWNDQLPWGPETAVPVGTALFDEAAYWSIKGETAGRGYAKDAYALATDPKRQHQFRQAVAQSVADMDAKLKQIGKVAPGKARQLADLFAKDPVKGATQLGTLFGTVEGEAGFIAAEVAFTPNKSAIARGIKNAGGRLVRFADDAGDAGRRLLGMRTAAKADDSLLDAARHGMPAADQTRWQAIVRQVEAHAKKHGYDIDVELSFRPRNVHSAALGDAGAGKNMFMKGKSGTEIDLLLGMDRSGLGKLVIYKPVKPANYAKLPASLRKELDQRIIDIEKARKEWLDPKSNLGRARTGKGVTLKAELTNPKTGEKIGTTNIKMRIAGYEKNGTISVKYLEHVVDGKVIVKPGKPKWVVSDYDGNAILRVGGKDLPGGALRGLVEGEVLRLQRENGAAMATSFHGFTYNGTDLPGKYYRNNFHFLLEGMTDAQAQKALDRYLRKYAVNQKDYDDLVSSYTNGDYVIRVTADAAYATQGL